MLARTFSTILLWAATLLAIIYFAAYGWAVIVALLSAAALHEVFEVQRKIRDLNRRRLLGKLPQSQFFYAFG